MPEKKKDATPGKVTPTIDSAMAHSIELDRLKLKNASLEVQLDATTKQLVEAKESLKKIEADYNTDVVTKHKMDIQMVLGCSDAERDKLCFGKDDKELAADLKRYVIGVAKRKPQEPGIFKSIRTGAAEPRKYGDSTENFTVGCLYGKSAEDIKKMGGQF